ncbi:hypothetical protein TREMEDRAFT_62443 [Tremella mesenterica DSM 1558]|uniref:uncharacterized protein n=1 Tax=Tremella mesenterica (strain ATCC 24925 / CBS 8224 / DSM 1558 / NBRC 9311 / NRRL Y-6157 / RJB 2259-6 / UBC 559-6) TaxID=578456 RepID=UPI0003F4A115|nr:uncharacterized protein TREMEDRAFT_62443 [Tremella mesenterica DSM 1558]EIW69583.1 hypothetical protein TREMEDRAFT_62443 [Tremella mesenterica DSM 1558]
MLFFSLTWLFIPAFLLTLKPVLAVPGLVTGFTTPAIAVEGTPFTATVSYQGSPVAAHTFAIAWVITDQIIAHGKVVGDLIAYSDLHALDNYQPKQGFELTIERNVPAGKTVLVAAVFSQVLNGPILVEEFYQNLTVVRTGPIKPSSA